MAQVENSGIIRAPKACYEEPSNVSAKADYYEGICDKMLLDSHYSTLTAKITAAKSKISDFRVSILDALTEAKGKVAARLVCETLMRNDMDALLADIQVVANNDPTNAIANITSLGVSYRTREGYTREDIEVRHGEVSASFDLLVKKPKGNYAVVWFFAQTLEGEDNWRMADFSHNTHGSISGLKPGTTYYFKAKVSSSKTGKSDWTYVVQIICN